MTIPTDAELTDNRSFKVAGDGDLATVSGKELIIQDTVVRLFNEADPNLGESITRLFVEEFEADIESALKSSDYVEPPYDVNVVDVEDETLTVNVSTAEYEYVTTINNE